MQYETFFSDKQLSLKYGVGRSSIWRWVQKGKFPKPIKLSPGCARWKLSDIEKWEADKEVEQCV